MPDSVLLSSFSSDPDFPARWFWRASDGRVFSPQAGLITAKHKAFTTFTASGRAATPWPKDDSGSETEAALDDVLRPYGLRCSQPALAEVKVGARASVIAFADQITARITSQYPAAEVASWPTQEAEARAVIGGADASAAPLISALAVSAKVALVDYANSVLAKASAYRQVVAAVKGIRDATDAAIDAAATPEAVGAALEQARQAALAKAAALGLA